MTLHYKAVGDGQDVLLIHGYASSLHLWDVLMQSDQTGIRWWAIDLPGFGASPLEADVLPDIDYYVDQVAAFCRAHGLRQCVVIGHSMGGMIALKLTWRYPDLVVRVVLAAAVITGRITANRNGWLARPRVRAALTHLRRFWGLTQHPRLSRFSVPPYALPSQARQRIQDDAMRAAPDALLYAFLSLVSEDLTPCLPDIQQPVLILVGTIDETVPADEGRFAAQNLSNASIVEFEGVHHQILDEAPERFTALVCDFSRLG